MVIKEEINWKNLMFGILSVIAGAGGFKGFEAVENKYFGGEAQVIESEYFTLKLQKEVHRQVMQELLHRKEDSKVSLRSLIADKADIPVDEVHIVIGNLLEHRKEFHVLKNIYLPILDSERRFVDVGVKYDKILGIYVFNDKNRQKKEIAFRVGIIDGAKFPYRMLNGRLQPAMY